SAVSLPSLESGMDAAADSPGNIEEVDYDCLQKCMQMLTPVNRKLILEYYEMKEQGDKETSQQLAADLGITLNSLRVRVHRVRLGLKQCIEKCRQNML